MMKRILVPLLFLVSAACAYSQKVVFTPQWTAQAQFAGYYMALEKGFFAEEGLDVEIRHSGQNSTEKNDELLVKGETQIAGIQLIQAIINRADGKSLVNVLQLTQKSGLWCVSRNPISDPVQMNGMRIGRWKVGFSEFCDMVECYKGIKVNWIPFINGINLYVFGAVDATLCYSYSEFISLELAMGKIPEDHILKFSEFGYNCPEDGLFVTEEYYAANKETVDKFVRACKKGWDYARNHRQEAVDVTMRICKENHVATNRAMQSKMLDSYLDLQKGEDGSSDYAPVTKPVFDDIVGALLNTGYITKTVNYNELIK